MESNDINISEYSLYDSRVSNTRTICVVYMVLSFLMVIYSFIEVIFINWEAGNKTFSSLTPMQYYMMSSAGFSGAFFALSMVMNHIFISMRLDNNCIDYYTSAIFDYSKSKKDVVAKLNIPIIVLNGTMLLAEISILIGMVVGDYAEKKSWKKMNILYQEEADRREREERG